MTDRRLTDQALLARLRAGEERAFDALYERYRVPLVRYAERVLAGRLCIAEDIVQEAFVRSLPSLLREDRPLAVGPWLHRIVLNGCLDQLRRPAPIATGERLELAPAPDDVHAAVARRETLSEVVRDVVALPPRQREALVSLVLGGRSHAEAAGARGGSVNAGKSLVSRARLRLVAARDAREAFDPPGARTACLVA